MKSPIKEEYKHTQIGYFLLSWYVAILMIMSILYILTEFHPIPLVGMIIMVIVIGIFASLTVIVSDQVIQIRFGIGAIRKDFPLKDIKTYQVVKNPWYYGWGIRYTPRGWLFRVSGRIAIEVEMKGGKLYRIGTDDPQRLAKAIDEALNKPPRQ